MKLQFLGHSAFYFEAEGIKGIIDPFIPNPLENPLFNKKDLTHIFVTHGHGDHLGDTINISKESGAQVICNFEIAQYLSKYDIECHAMHIGGRATLDFGKVKMTPALHGSGIITKDEIIYGGSPCGFVIDVAGKKLYHAGDTGLTMDMQLLSKENIDVALIPIGGNFTMDIEDAIEAVKFIRPKVTIPMHYNTFPIISAEPLNFKEKVANSEVKLLEAGDVFEF
ncbi:metal-dependent hydrolase [Alkaliphilus peptidifermentans]|uniref:UPF0173 metal-dependent hydrolase SAMN03080606_01473 n=1 Tax=Alkaliphilus peptidifermentans DSM 18978 TaxID=1120976 RepID=A0A1G5FMV5_9FIRM|nr:metal-dependent hydrolase [Alkaliphilus peptidifermentans]SCY40576.1 L-ascorbate metabolism protein UlaG, beta-lactamase superfamily [Alkaliphilus peptidifermentans DSM 18978]